MFLLEAIPAVILGFVVFFFLTDRPEKATWLASDERDWLVSTMNAEHAAKGAKAHHSIWSGLSDMRVLALSLIYFGTSAGLYTLGIWAPQIIQQFDISTMQVGLLNAVPPTVAIVAMIIWARHSDQTAERTWHVVIACLVAAVGLALAGLAGSVVTVVAALTLREHWDQLGEASAVEHANYVFVGFGGSRRHRNHQFNRESRRVCRADGNRLDQGHDGKFSRRPLFRSRSALPISGTDPLACRFTPDGSQCRGSKPVRLLRVQLTQ